MKFTLLFSVCLVLGLAYGVADEFFVYFGTYTGAKSKGIYRARFDAATGKLTGAQLAAETRNPSFLALHPRGTVLYVVGEVDNARGKRAGAVLAYAIEPQTGRLTLLNEETSGGTGPCHISVDATGQCALVANYGSGSIAALPIHADGSLGAAVTTIQHTGSSVNPQRQSGPHAHCLCPSPDNRFALAADLGLDQVLVYHLDAAAAKLTPNLPPFVTVAPGAGPRHLAFHPHGRFVYVINEMKPTVTVLRYDAARGALVAGQTVSTLPADYTVTGKDSGAEIAVHPSGKFVYGSNRGHDSIAVFAVDADTGGLRWVQSAPTLGRIPRHFAIDPTGRWLLAENQDSDSVVTLAIDPTDGRLTPTGQTCAVPTPICALFVKSP